MALSIHHNSTVRGVREISLHTLTISCAETLPGDGAEEPVPSVKVGPMHGVKKRRVAMRRLNCCRDGLKLTIRG